MKGQFPIFRNSEWGPFLLSSLLLVNMWINSSLENLKKLVEHPSYKQDSGSIPAGATVDALNLRRRRNSFAQ